jgi:demethylmenaquinone methyltransferase/2-methoxy-6-polyprenyl-1,4-benzoquinol methylase
VDDEAVLSEQRQYYRERAPEYDDWWFRRGRYANDPPHVRAGWFADVAAVEHALEEFEPRGDVLELAGGTGLWTRHLVRDADTLTVVDASPEVLELNRARVSDARVDYVVADLFEWQPPRRYDVCFFGFWLSHVPESRFASFWTTVADALQPEGRVYLIDSSHSDAVHTGERREGERERRRTADGREFEIVKRFWEPGELSERLADLGWRFDLRRSANGHFLHGAGARA